MSKREYRHTHCGTAGQGINKIACGVIKVSKSHKTFLILLIAVIFTLSFIGTASAADHTVNGTASSTASETPTATAAPSATPVPTPAPRQVFSSPGWNTDHETIVATNSGAAITVVAWINDPSNSINYSVNASETKTVSTPSILAQNGQIVSFGFDAYENQTLIQSIKSTITLNLAATPTPLPPESATISGQVVDAGSGAPIAGAKITFAPESVDKTYGPVTTDGDGFFTSPKMYTGLRYTIRVMANGYQAISSTTDDKVAGDITIGSSIALTRLAGATTPTPTPVPPSPTPANTVDSWLGLVNSPISFLGALTALVTAIGGSIGIYEWMEKRRKPGEKKP